MQVAAQTLQAMGRLSRPRFCFFQKEIGAEEAAQRVAQHQPISFECDFLDGDPQQASSPAELEAVYRSTLDRAHVAAGFQKGEKVLLRTGQADDKPTFQAIDRLAFSHPWPSWAFDKYLVAPTEADTATLATTADGQAVGMICVEYGRIQPDAAAIDDLGVIPPAQGNRVGERLLVAALQQAREHGSQHAFLEVDVTNFPAQHLYTRCGFQQVETLPGYYSEAGHDGYLMELKDLQSPAVGAHLAELLQQG